MDASQLVSRNSPRLLGETVVENALKRRKLQLLLPRTVDVSNVKIKRQAKKNKQRDRKGKKGIGWGARSKRVRSRIWPEV